MKKMLVILIAVLAIWTGFSCGPKPPAAIVEPTLEIITDSSGENVVELPAMLKALDRHDVIFIGEIHDDSLTHVIEHRLLQEIHQKDSDLAVAMEMFERDAQPHLNSYLAGSIPEAEFLENSRPWSNYAKAYKPIIEYAKLNKLPVLAGFVPRRYAAMVARGGEAALNEVPDSERGLIARELKALDDEYKKRFMKQMGGDEKSQMMGMRNLDNIYKAQCIKDDTMAETIADFLKNAPGKKVVTYQGDFHSAFGLGSVKKLNLLMPEIKTIVISVVPVDDFDNVKPTEYKGQGDYMIFVPRVKQAR